MMTVLCVAATNVSAQKQKREIAATDDLFETTEIRDVSTLDAKVLQDWHVDTVNGKTRQKLIEIKVAEWWPGQDYRVPVRMIVPRERKAKGFHITGGHPYKSLRKDAQMSRLESRLLEGGVGVVYTIVQPLQGLPGGAVLSRAMSDRFGQSLNPRHTDMWIWSMTLMRAVTAAYAETDYFEPGKVAGSGGSKNGAAPAIALINDDRFTATCSSVAPAYASPLRLCDQAAMDAVNAANDRFFEALDAGQVDPGEHPAQWYQSNARGPFGKGLHKLALEAGWTWEDIRRLTRVIVNMLCVSENCDRLMARGADVLFQPGTHDWVAHDILWGAQNHPEVPVYYKPNWGHGQTAHPAAEDDAANLNAFLIKHFFGDDPMLQPPKSSYEINGDELHVTVTFEKGPQAESGRIWWIYDRDPGGSAGFLWKRIPDDQWMDMTFDAETGAWTAVIALDTDASTVDFFSNHGLGVNGYKAYLSSPYTRVTIEGETQLKEIRTPDVAYVPTPQDVVDKMLHEL